MLPPLKVKTRPSCRKPPPQAGSNPRQLSKNLSIKEDDFMPSNILKRIGLAIGAVTLLAVAAPGSANAQSRGLLPRTGDGPTTPTVTRTPRPSETPRATRTPEPTRTPRATETPRATRTPFPTRTPDGPTTPTVTRTPRATWTPFPTRTPDGTTTPTVTRTPHPTRTPAPTPEIIVTPLTSDVATTGTVNARQWAYYSIEVPKGAWSLDVVLTGSNDADLYLNRETVPSNFRYIARRVGDTSNETISLSKKSWPKLVGGTKYFIGVLGHSTAASEYSLTALVNAGAEPTPTPTRTPVPTPVPGVETTLLDIKALRLMPRRWFSLPIKVREGVSEVNVVLSGEDGNADLFVRKARSATLRSFDFAPKSDDSNETVTLNSTSTPPLSKGTWFVSVYARERSTVDLKVTAK